MTLERKTDLLLILVLVQFVFIVVGVIIVRKAAAPSTKYATFASNNYSALQLERLSSVHDRVVVVVQNWATTVSLPTDKQELDVLWSTSGKSFEFYPSASQILTAKLQHEFRDSKTSVLQYTDIYADANTAGKVKTVSDLATAVRQNYDPQ